MQSLPLMDMDKIFGTVEWSDLCSPSDRWRGLWNGGPGPIHPTAPPLCLYTFLWRVFQSSEPQGNVTCENWLSPQHEMFEGRTREGYIPRRGDSATRWQQNWLKRPKKQGTCRLRSCLIILMFDGPIFQKKKSHVINHNCLRCLSSSKITENWDHHVSGLEDSGYACLLSFISVFTSTSTLNMDAPLQASKSRWHLKKLGLFLLLQRVK